jgi:N utilization substance protein B
MGNRTKSREIAVKIFYQLELGGLPLNEAIDTFYGSLTPHPVSDAVKEYANRIVKAGWPLKTEIDRRLELAAPHWKLERMARIDLAILRLCATEIICFSDVPRVVAINEAIELAKKFSSENAPSFINGVLDTLDDSPAPSTDQAVI